MDRENETEHGVQFHSHDPLSRFGTLGAGLLESQVSEGSCGGCALADVRKPGKHVQPLE